MVSNLILVAIIIGLHSYWIYAILTYDWSKHEEDMTEAEKEIEELWKANF
jgi:hypothetical protein